MSSRRSSVEAKMQRTSWKVRKSSTVTACPVVVSLCSWKGRRHLRNGKIQCWTGDLERKPRKAEETGEIFGRGGEFSQEKWKVPRWVMFDGHGRKCFCVTHSGIVFHSLFPPEDFFSLLASCLKCKMLFGKKKKCELLFKNVKKRYFGKGKKKIPSCLDYKNIRTILLVQSCACCTPSPPTLVSGTLQFLEGFQSGSGWIWKHLSLPSAHPGTSLPLLAPCHPCFGCPPKC